jgi:ABC-type transporter Mla maintaining outer membrane lipid asymmetry ATPase subunit MlaF
MEAPVRFIDARLPPILAGATRAFGEGSVSEIVAAGGEECALLVKAIAGLSPLEGGKILLFGQDPGDLSRSELCDLRFRTGIVHHGGGLISNLKAVENVALPLLYHSHEGAREISERAIAALERAGYRGNLFELPGRLSAYQRRVAGFARVIAIDPEVILYDRLTDGLYAEEKEALLGTAFAFHREKPGRVSIFLSTRPGSIPGDPPAAVVRLTKGTFE